MTKFFLLLSAAAIASPACAQDIPDPDAPEIVVTATRAAQPLSEIGQAVTVIDRPFGRSTLETVRGAGYRLDDRVPAVTAA